MFREYFFLFADQKMSWYGGYGGGRNNHHGDRQYLDGRNITDRDVQRNECTVLNVRFLKEEAVTAEDKDATGLYKNCVVVLPGKDLQKSFEEEVACKMREGSGFEDLTVSKQKAVLMDMGKVLTNADMKPGKIFVLSSASSSGIGNEAMKQIKEMQEEQNKFMREQMEWMREMHTGGQRRKSLSKKKVEEDDDDEDDDPNERQKPITKPMIKKDLAK